MIQRQISKVVIEDEEEMTALEAAKLKENFILYEHIMLLKKEILMARLPGKK